MAIRYDKKLNTEINRVIRNYNQKIRRLEKNQSLMSIPDTVTKRELTQSVYRRRDLQRKLNDLKAFSKRGMEQNITLKSGARISKYDFYKLKKEAKRQKLRLNAEIKRLQTAKPKSLGIFADVTFAQTGDNAFLTVIRQREKLNKDLSSLSAQELTKYGNYLLRLDETRNYYDTLFKNYYLEMFRGLGDQLGYDQEKMGEIINRFDKLPPDQFYKLFKEEKAIARIQDYDFSPKKGFNGSIDIDSIKEDVINAYDDLYDNLDEILKEYETIHR